MTLFERFKIWLINVLPDFSWLPPGVLTNGELKPHLPSKTNPDPDPDEPEKPESIYEAAMRLGLESQRRNRRPPMRFDQYQRAQKRQRKGLH